MGETLVIHKRIIAVSFITVGIFMILLVSILLYRTPFYDLHGPGKFSIVISTIAGILQISAGHALLKNHRWAHRLSLPSSIVLLISFPFGTVLGLYYLRFRYKFRTKKI